MPISLALPLGIAVPMAMPGMANAYSRLELDIVIEGYNIIVWLWLCLEGYA